MIWYLLQCSLLNCVTLRCTKVCTLYSVQLSFFEVIFIYLLFLFIFSEVQKNKDFWEIRAKQLVAQMEKRD